MKTNKYQKIMPVLGKKAVPVSRYQTTFVKEIYVNSEDVEKELNQWLKDNEENFEIMDIKISSCYFRDCQTKTIVLIFYRETEKNPKQ